LQLQEAQRSAADLENRYKEARAQAAQASTGLEAERSALERRMRDEYVRDAFVASFFLAKKKEKKKQQQPPAYTSFQVQRKAAGCRAASAGRADAA
jgi:hypothetical protein